MAKKLVWNTEKAIQELVDDVVANTAESVDEPSLAAKAIAGQLVDVFPVYDADGSTLFSVGRTEINIRKPLKMNGQTISGLPTPIAPDEAATKAYADSVGGGGGGSTGSGVLNYLSASDSDAETADIGNWATYQDAAGPVPIDATGGNSSSLMLVVTTTAGEVLNGIKSFKLTKSASNAQGQGISVPFDVPLGYRNKKARISLKFKILSGSILDGDVLPFVIQDPAGIPSVITPFNVGKLTGSQGELVAYFDPSISQGSYKLALHFASTSIPAVTIAFDDVNISDQQVAYGMPGNDWISYSPAWTAATTNPVIGNGVLTGQYRRVGDTLEGIIKIEAGSTTTFGSGQWSFGLPPGLSVDLAKLNPTSRQYTNVNGQGQAYDASSGNDYMLRTFCDPAGKISSEYYSASATYIGLHNFVSSAGPMAWAVSDLFWIRFSVPITNWSSNVQFGESTTHKISNFIANGTRVVGVAPAKLGEWRALRRSASTETYNTDDAPAILPSSANGFALYKGTGWTTVDAVGEPSRYDIFVGKNKNVKLLTYVSPGRTGIADVSIAQTSGGGTAYGYVQGYDPTTGIFSILPFYGNSSVSARYCGYGPSGALSGPIYADLIVSENALMVAAERSFTDSGFAGSDWTSYTPTITNIPVSVSRGMWRRVGDTMEVMIQATASGAATGIITAGLPSGYVPDASKILQGGMNSYGIAYGNNASTNFEGVVGYASPTTFRVQSHNSTAAWSAATPFTWASSHGFEMIFRVPIAGWSSNVALGASSTFKISSLLSTRVTTVPAALGEYRARYKSTAAYNGTLTDTAPSVAPSSANGLMLYGNVAGNAAGTAGQAAVYDIFIGRYKNWKTEYYQSTGRSGAMDASYAISGTTELGTRQSYDPSTGVLTIDAAYTTTNSSVVRFLASVYGNALGSGYFDVTVSDNALLVGADIAAGTQAGGATGVNYISSSDSNGDSGVGNWVTYADAAAATPVDALGGTASALTLAVTAVAGEVLNGAQSFKLVKTAVNAQGQGVSVPFTVPLGYRSKKARIALKFKVLSGSVVENDILAAVVQDPTGTPSVIVPLHVGKLVGSQGELVAYFDPALTQGSYRLALHFASTNAAAVTIAFDDINISDNAVIYGMAGSDWQSFPMVISAATTAPIKGGIVRDEARWRRVGDTMEISYNLQTNSAGTAGSGLYLYNLPAGYSIDTTKQPFGVSNFQGVVGHGGAWSSTGYDIQVYVRSATQLALTLTNDTNNGIDQASGALPLSNASVYISFNAKFPIVGWTSNTQLGESATYRISNYLANGVRVSGVAPAKLGEWRSYTRAASTVTYSDVAPSVLPTIADGVRLWKGNNFGASDTANSPSRYDVFVGKNKNVRWEFFANAARSTSFDPTNRTDGGSLLGCTIAYNPTTGIASIANTVTGGVAVTQLGLGLTPDQNTATNGYFDIIVSENTLMVAADTPASMGANRSTAFSIPAGAYTTIPFNTVEFDTLGNYDPITGRFTASRPGKYRISSHVYIQGASWTAGDAFQVFVFRNGVVLKALGIFRPFVTRPDDVGTGGSTVLHLNTGDYVEIMAHSARAGNIQVGYAGLTYLNIECVEPGSSTSQNITLMSEGLAYGGSGFGSASTLTRHMTTVSTTGSAFTMVSNTTTGLEVTIKEQGIYAISYVESFDGGNSGYRTNGVSRNASGSTFPAYPVLLCAAMVTNQATFAALGPSVATLRLQPGDVLRPVVSSTTGMINVPTAHFRITQIGR